MNISICITVKNEEGSIGRLLDSLLAQTKKPDEIIVVDGGSIDRTIETINHYQKKAGNIRLLKEKCTRARGRNLGVEVARYEIIAITDAGCISQPSWLEKITDPFMNKEIDVVAGFYKMIAKNPMQKAMRIFLGVLPGKFDNSFLPSTRSIAFRKSVWEAVGGFPEDLDTAEDTVFNYKIIKAGVRISRVKDAVVEWGMPSSIFNFYFSIFNYAKGDVKSKIWIFPKKGLASHNIKAIFVNLRYVFGLFLFVFGFYHPVILVLLFILVILYIFRAFRKAGLWGILLQFVSDLAVTGGFISGLMNLPRRRPSATIRGVF